MRVLTDQEVLELRAMHAGKASYRDIGAHFGIPWQSVKNLATRRRRVFAEQAMYARKTKKPPEGGEG